MEVKEIKKKLQLEFVDDITHQIDAMFGYDPVDKLEKRNVIKEKVSRYAEIYFNRLLDLLSHPESENKVIKEINSNNPRMQCSKCGKWRRLFLKDGTQTIMGGDTDTGDVCIYCVKEFGLSPESEEKVELKELTDRLIDFKKVLEVRLKRSKGADCESMVSSILARFNNLIYSQIKVEADREGLTSVK